MQQIAFQTPIPALESEAILAVAVLIWIIAAFLFARRFSRIWHHVGEIISFLVFFAGLLLIAILMF